ncbi:MAG: hypothetical protein OXI60_00840, partial [Acidiferrobacterales bacterium]|nr:hypothetical protein [Acidiferrobacterales bacterium]
IGKLAFAHVKKQDELHDVTTMGSDAIFRVNTAAVGADPIYRVVRQVNVTVAADYANMEDGMLDDTGADAVVRSSDGTFSIGTCDADDAEADDACRTATVWYWEGSTTSYTDGGGAVTTATTNEYYAEAEEVDAVPAMTSTEVKTAGSSASHVAFQMGLGGVTGHLGYSEIKTNGMMGKDKITHYGLSGGIGDTGVSYLLQARNKKLADGSSKSPWLVAVTRSLGGGSTVMLEHGNDDGDKSGKTRVGVKVDF